MTALHPFHSLHHVFRHVGLKYLLPILLALLLFFLLATPVRGQVLVDESQLGGKLPSWVDPAYDKIATPPADAIVVRPPIFRPPCEERVWRPPVTQTITERVWVEDRYEYRMVEVYEFGHHYWRRVLVLVEPGHFTTRCREIVIVPGHWETVPWDHIH